MRVHCGVCGGEPAAVLCCADEAALCSACDSRVHRANKLAGKHRRLPLVHPSDASSGDAAAGPLCDVCKERRGLVFCVEDRAILCADCDDPIHSANELTAKHSRFLLVGAKLSAALVDQAPPSPDCVGGSGSGESDDVPASCAQDSSTGRSSVLECGGGGGGGARISDYLTNICPGWRVDDLLCDDAAFSAVAKAGRGEHERVPFMDADLFDVVAGRLEKRGAWAPAWTGEPSFEEVPAWTGEPSFKEVPAAAMAAPTAAKAAKQGRVRETSWNSCDNDSDVFAVPEIKPPPSKKARPSSFWCF